MGRVQWIDVSPIRASGMPIIGLTAKLERETGDNEGREEDRQKALPGASEGDGLALGGIEAPGSA